MANLNAFKNYSLSWCFWTGESLVSESKGKGSGLRMSELNLGIMISFCDAG